MPDRPPTLEELVAEGTAALTSGVRGDDEPSLLAWLAEADGHAPLADLRNPFSELTLTRAATRDTQDARRGPRIRLAEIGGEATAWLTSAGWQRAGHPNRREHTPSPAQAAHRRAPRAFGRWVGDNLAPRFATVAEFHLLTGPALRDHIDQGISEAWAQVRRGIGADEAGKLLGGLYPDALLVEGWRPEARRWRADLYGEPHPGEDLDRYVAVEIELSDKGAGRLGAKILQHDRAMGLHWWHSVLWVLATPGLVRSYQRLTSVTRLDPGFHFVADPVDVGITPPTAQRITSTTWPWHHQLTTNLVA